MDDRRYSLSTLYPTMYPIISSNTVFENNGLSWIFFIDRETRWLLLRSYQGRNLLDRHRSRYNYPREHGFNWKFLDLFSTIVVDFSQKNGRNELLRQRLSTQQLQGRACAMTCWVLTKVTSMRCNSSRQYRVPRKSFVLRRRRRRCCPFLLDKNPIEEAAINRGPD